MKKILFAFLLLGCACHPKAQPDTDSLLREAEKKLQSGAATVSALLTDPRYQSVHPVASFRKLIESYSTDAILKISTTGEPGKKIRVLGTVTDKDNNPVAGALVYLYQTDAKGWYAAGSPHVGGNEGDMRQARLFGYVKTDAAGKFELHTIKPAGYPRSDLPAHIHVHVWAEGYNPFVNEFLFDDDERLTGEIREQSIRNRFLIQPPENAPAPFEQQFSYQLVLVKK